MTLLGSKKEEKRCGFKHRVRDLGRIKGIKGFRVRDLGHIKGVKGIRVRDLGPRT